MSQASSVNEPKEATVADEVAKLFYETLMKNSSYASASKEDQKVALDFAKKVVAVPGVYNVKQLEKWKKSFLKRQRQKAEDIYNLFKMMRNTRNLNDLLDQVQAKLTELCVGDEEEVKVHVY